ncbi:glycerol-3-phosphate 1-O-acyltransferase [Arenicella sp.]|nr:glycerol-3-phosphate 1-O-acyltransferase [Arenicella sp.]
MPINPWQQVVADAASLTNGIKQKVTSILFIIDAANPVEEQLLHDWLDTTRNNTDYTGVADYFVGHIDDDLNSFDNDKLGVALSMLADAVLVPVRVVWKSKLDNPNIADVDKPRWRDLIRGNPRKPSHRKAQRIIISDPSRAVCVMGVPASLGWLKNEFKERQKNAVLDRNLAEFVLSQASLALEIAERRLRGSRYKVPRQVARQIQLSDRFKRGLQSIMADGGESEQALRKRALPIFKELIAIPQNFWQDVMATFNRWVIRLGYENELVIDQERLVRFRKIVREHPTALLWTHKTHMDGLTMQSVLFENDFPTPHTMGGINMAFAGVGFLARRSGAIFIRRSFQDNPLYKLVLRNYLSYLLEKRFPLTWSFEGTRSRVGKLMPPKYGMLKYVMDAIVDSSAEELYVIPVAINYDMINDVKDYAHEQSGGVKRPESLSWFISYLRRLRRPLGRIYVDFGEPVVIHKSDINDDPLQLTKTALKVGFEANRVTPITLTSLMCLSLLGSSPRAQTLDEISQNLHQLQTWARRRNVRFTSDFDDANQEHMQKIIAAMVNNELIVRYDEGPEVVYALDAEQHPIASYYRNTIVHHFVTKAIIELALVGAARKEKGALARFWYEADRLRDLFKFEFFYAPAEDFVKDVKTELGQFDPDWQNKLDNQKGYAHTILTSTTPLIAHATLRPYIESYRIMVDVFARLDADQTLDQKAALVAAFKYAKQAYLQRRISSKASIGKLLFSNAYKVVQAQNLLEAGDAFTKQNRKKASKRLRTLTHRLEHIRLLALPEDI